MARAACTFPMSADSHPNWSRKVVTNFFASSSFPQINIVGISGNPGFTIRVLPTQLKTFTNIVVGTFFEVSP